MSVFLNPIDGRIPPTTVIGFENLLARFAVSVNTSSLVLAEIARVILPVSVWEQVGRALRLSIQGRFNGNTAVDTKQLQILLGAHVLFDTGLLALNNLAFWLKLEVSYGLSGAGFPLIQSRAFNVLTGLGGFTSAPTFQGQPLAAVTFDPNLQQDLIFNARVQNAANSVAIDRITGTLL